jgi:hypothetical protein
MSRDGKFQGGGQGQQGAIGAGKAEPGEYLDEFDLASDLKNNNRLTGNDQGSQHSQRQAVADGKGETDGLIESFEKLDKDVRAERDLGKGNRHKPH